AHRAAAVGQPDRRRAAHHLGRAGGPRGGHRRPGLAVAGHLPGHQRRLPGARGGQHVLCGAPGAGCRDPGAGLRGVAVSALFRLVGIGGVLAYRALFNWTTPGMFVGTLLVGPLFQLLFFAYLGRQLQVADDRFYIVGNAVLAASLACVFGGTMAVANERRYGTLGHVLLSPRSRTAIFLGRALPYAGNGLLIAVV